MIPWKIVLMIMSPWIMLTGLVVHAQFVAMSHANPAFGFGVVPIEGSQWLVFDDHGNLYHLREFNRDRMRMVSFPHLEVYLWTWRGWRFPGFRVNTDRQGMQFVRLF